MVRLNGMMDDAKPAPPAVFERPPNQPSHDLGSQTGQSRTEPKSDVHRVTCDMHRSRLTGNAARPPSRLAASARPRPTPRAEAQRELRRRCPVDHLDYGDISIIYCG